MSTFPGRSQAFLAQLQERVIIGDGAMGTLLYSRGIPLDGNFEHLNLVRPELVRQGHADYAAAGARLLETNTFGANALRLGAIGLEKKVAAINGAGARLAREAAGADGFVAGAVGPLLPPRGETTELTPEAKSEIFTQQMSALAEGGVDLFLLETFTSLEDLELALAVSATLGLPALAQMAFLEEGRTRAGVSAEAAVRRLSAAGAAGLGANCGGGPRELLRVLERMARVTALPLSAFPNSGFPEYHDGRYIYLATPEYFSAVARDMVAAGATLIGGCCGTTPEHIRALSAALAGSRPAPRPRPVPSAVVPAATATAPPELAGTFLASWGKRTVVTVELDPPRGLDCRKLIVGARALTAAGADAISLAENPLARIRLGNIAAARTLHDEVGCATIVHITGRDRNLIGLHSDLMGAHLLGLRNILAVTGDPVAVGGESGASSVFDLNSVGILQLLAALNGGHNLLGAELDGATSFLCGAAFNPNLPSMDGQLRRLQKKIAAGARFVQTQPVYDVAILEELVTRTAPLGIPVLVGLLPLVSERNAEFLHNEVPGITLPPAVRARMRGKHGAAGVSEGMAIARELIEAGRGQVGGWYLMPPFGKIDLACELMASIRATSPAPLR
ncbi:MAG TPA: bifunctional homocysteine S-methyltransferase/methylenetetrahydrofolate reductase [Desulfuromonas sp.]|nr:bifunctional homocysteine S-methyltransferase/methylenetetrahydrofolate reductase [Desulfuromonas sp.]